MSGTEIRSAGGKLFIGGVELPGHCVDYGVDDDPLSTSLRVEVTLLVKRDQQPAPAVRAFQDDGGNHFTSTSPGGRVTPSGKNACVRCGEAWPCSTAMHRFNDHGDYSPAAPSAWEADLLRRLDEVRRLVHQYTESGWLAVGHGNRLLGILNAPQTVDKDSGESLG